MKIQLLIRVLFSWACWSLTGEVLAKSHLPQSDSPFVADQQRGLYWNARNCCGLVAAYQVLHRQGKPVELEKLSQQLTFGQEGTSLVDLSRLFESYGLRAEAREIDANALQKLLRGNPSLACIALVDSSHWVTLEADETGQFLYFDYPRWYSQPVDGFVRRYSGKVLLISPKWSMASAFSPAVLCVAVGVLSACFAGRHRRNENSFARLSVPSGK